MHRINRTVVITIDSLTGDDKSWVMRRIGAGAYLMLSLAVAIPLRAQTYQTLFNFNDGNGAAPNSALIQATDGNLYGTTLDGGTGTWGTVFKVTPTGAFTTIYNFCSTDGCADGIGPTGLIQGSDGNFYGTTVAGGILSDGNPCQFLFSCGTVFKMTPKGVLTTIYTFCSESGCTDGAYPNALIQAVDGNFYGTTSGGGTVPCIFFATTWGCGTVFKLTPGGILTTLHSFGTQNNDGIYPVAGLIQASDGNFYGTTYYGGAGTSCWQGGDSPGDTCGTVFKITPTGALTILHSFDASDGGNPKAALLQANDGNLYGTTSLFGANSWGTAFKITRSGTLTTLQSFGGANGQLPEAALIQAEDGNLYGTTDDTIFKLTTNGLLSILHSLTGAESLAALVQDTNGKFYGTTLISGDSNACTGGCGTIFRLSTGLGQFVKPEPDSGVVGASVNILGTALSGATAVTFNGTAANFAVESSSLITTTIPTGASSGQIEVTTPHGTLKSNVPFRVIP
jgi:uncharacterized repeat protein (TIGR03803 family)